MNFLKKNLTKNLFQIVFLVLLIIMPIFSFADPTPSEPSDPTPSEPFDPCKGKICNPISGADTVQEFIAILLEGVLRIGMPIIALAVIYCGFLFVSAMGKPEKLTKAKDALLYTLIGATILLGSWAIAELVLDTVVSLGS